MEIPIPLPIVEFNSDGIVCFLVNTPHKSGKIQTCVGHQKADRQKKDKVITYRDISGFLSRAYSRAGMEHAFLAARTRRVSFYSRVRLSRLSECWCVCRNH